MNDTTTTKPFLSPIEKPKGLLKKIGFFFIRRQFGRVFTPLKVHSTRMPTAIFLFYGKLGQLDKKLSLAPETALLA
jgi:hypothetical protein